MRNGLPLFLLFTLLLPHEAEASPPLIGADAGSVIAVSLGAIALGAVIAPIGAMVTTLDGEPSAAWGHSSLVFGGISTLAGGVSLAVAAHEDDTSFYVVGGIALGLGLNGLLWGVASQATLPERDPGIQGRPRPADGSTPAMFTVRGSF